jgi:preprotein translocase subunit SecG
MGIALSLILVLQVLSALGVIVLVLLQHGKGADMGAAFGGGASGSLFGATGSANFLSRTTAVLATIFFVCTLTLAFLSNRRAAAPKSIMEQPVKTAPQSEVPGQAAPAPAGAAKPDSPKEPALNNDAGAAKSGQPNDIPK